MKINHTPKLGIIQEASQTLNENIKNKKQKPHFTKIKWLCFSTASISSIDGVSQAS